jgi:hypothetical protein
VGVVGVNVIDVSCSTCLTTATQKAERERKRKRKMWKCGGVTEANVQSKDPRTVENGRRNVMRKYSMRKKEEGKQKLVAENVREIR